MKKKELKNLAKQIAKLELIIQASTDDEAVKNAQNTEIRLINRLDSLEDMDLLDEMVQQYMQEEN